MNELVQERSRVLFDALLAGEKSLGDLRIENELGIQTAIDMMALWYERHPRAARLLWVRPIPRPTAPKWQEHLEDRIKLHRELLKDFQASVKADVLPRLADPKVDVRFYDQSVYLPVEYQITGAVYAALVIIDPRGVAFAWGSKTAHWSEGWSRRVRMNAVTGVYRNQSTGPGFQLLNGIGAPRSLGPNIWKFMTGRPSKDLIWTVNRKLRDEIERKGRRR